MLIRSENLINAVSGIELLRNNLRLSKMCESVAGKRIPAFDSRMSPRMVTLSQTIAVEAAARAECGS